jgi:hypothetical protein
MLFRVRRLGVNQLLRPQGAIPCLYAWGLIFDFCLLTFDLPSMPSHYL